jgi:hypothetical protein
LNVLDFVISVVVGVAVALGWLAIWTAVLRAFGILVFSRSLEKRAGTRERFIRMGKLRYVIFFGVFGSGFAFGLGIAIAGLIAHATHDWIGAVIQFTLSAILFGCWQGFSTWNEMRGPTPFPPSFLSQK